MRGTAEGALRSCPAKCVQTESRPMRGGIATGIHLLTETKQTKMTGLMGAESGDLDVVAEEMLRLRNSIIASGEELFLVIEARSPSEVCTDFEIFANDLSNHVARMNTLSRLRVMRTPCRMDMMVTRP